MSKKKESKITKKKSFITLPPNEKNTLHIIDVDCNAYANPFPGYVTSSPWKSDMYD